MKTVLKSLLVGLMVFALSFSPALAGLAKAGGFNFEGISSIKTDDTQNYEKQPRGLMFNFSFGGQKDYNKPKPQVASMYNETASVVLTVAYLGVIALILLNSDDDDIVHTRLPPDDPPPEN